MCRGLSEGDPENLRALACEVEKRCGKEHDQQSHNGRNDETRSNPATIVNGLRAFGGGIKEHGAQNAKVVKDADNAVDDANCGKPPQAIVDGSAKDEKFAEEPCRRRYARQG